MLLTASCSSSTRQLEVTTRPIDNVEITYPKPAPVVSPDIHIIVITPDRTEQWNEQIKEGKEPYVFFAFDEDDYLSLSQWLQDLLRYIKSQEAIINAYENNK